MIADLSQKILAELKVFGSRCFCGMPPKSSVLSPHDVVFLKNWTSQDLLKLARQYSAQVAIHSKEELDPALMPFVDWVLSKDDEVQAFEQQAQKSYDSTVNIHVPAKTKSALFLDRDGVVNVDHGYVSDPKQVELIPYASLLISSAKQKGKEVIIITNQSGIGRGFYSEDDFNRVMDRISELLQQERASLDWIEFSPFHVENTHENYRLGRQFRKPRPGMIHRAAEKRGIELQSSTMVGDRVTDLKAAILAGVGKVFLYSGSTQPPELKECQAWTEALRTKFGLNLMDGIQLRAITSLAEAEI
jgi:D-glycero-D-manno-heptose 1,7-bisphosphate phosphatase